MTKTYPTKTQATKAKKSGQQVYQRRDKSWAIRWPRQKGVDIKRKMEVSDGE